MVVDDSVVIRGLTARWLEEAGHQVVATASNGRIAVEQIARAEPEIVLLDIEMPEMDGITALPLLLAARPRVSIVVVSTLTQRNAQTSLKCLALGAVDYLAKPESHRGVSTSMTFRHDLLLKIEGLSSRHRRAQTGLAASQASASQTMAAPARAAVGAASAPAVNRLYRAPAPGAMVRSAVPASTAPAAAPASPPRLRPIAANIHRRVLVVGASTGGPRAVGEFLSGLGPALKTMPICVVQHMPPIFTAVFAEHLGAQTGLQSAEGRDGEVLEAGRIYVAPGGKHMGLRREGGNIVRLRIDDGPPVNFCKPAVDVLFHDVAAIFGGATLAVVLTGMGADGTHGARAIGEAGGAILVQDEATSTVWGMPGSIAKAGLAHEILPLQALAPAAKKYMGGGR
ncbi:MAG: chemotaxis-specific protein-glutamate methyltransferase CheB [Salinarimonadaceae bacterium]|nr:MAG: chemotaxis-specific protein-glutamate methyltransferase CheB [Salinarimonadaceae bacterium]